MTDRLRRPAVWLWLAFVVACAAVAARTHFTADLSAFLPRAPTAEQQLLVDQLRDGLVSRLVLVGIEDARPEDSSRAAGSAAARAAVSRGVAAILRKDPRFVAVSNGEPVSRERDRQYLFDHRYLLSAAVTPAHFTETGLRAAVGDTLDLLASPAGLFAKSLLPRDPTGEMTTLLERLGNAGHVRMQDGAWASRDGKRAVLLLQTRASGADTDAQADAMQAIRAAFAQATDDVRRAAAGPDAAVSLRMVMTGPGVISVDTRDTIKREVERLSTLGVALIVALLWFVYRSVPALVLGLVPVLSGALAGVAAVSLCFGTVHGLTLGFGTTLIGEAVDYAIYLFAQTSRPGSPWTVGPDGQEQRRRAWLQTFWPTVRLGVMTSVCGFAALLLSGFPGLAQLGLYSVVGLTTAAIVTRFVVPWLMPDSFRLRDLEPLGSRLARLAAGAARLRWPALAAVLAAGAWLVAMPRPLWSQSLTALSPVPAHVQALDAALRADVGAPDVRFLVVVAAHDQETTLQHAERIARQLQPLADQGVIGGFDNPALFLPSQATQRARQAALPAPDALRNQLAAAVSDMPVRPAVFKPFLDDIEHARTAPLLRRDDLQGTSMAIAVNGLLTERDGHWTATLPLRAPERQPPAGQGSSLDAERVRAAIAGAGLQDVLFVDLKGESDRMYASYMREALHLSLYGALAIVILLSVALRSPRRVIATLLPLVAAAIVVIALLAATGRQLTLLHLVGLLLLTAVGSNYALFFNGAANDARNEASRNGKSIVDDANGKAVDGSSTISATSAATQPAAPAAPVAPRVSIAPNTLVSLMLANATTVAAFGLLGFSSLPMLEAFGLTVGPGAMLALMFSAIFASLWRRPSARKAASSSHASQ